jgi:hypothetical protein
MVDEFELAQPGSTVLCCSRQSSCSILVSDSIHRIIA